MEKTMSQKQITGPSPYPWLVYPTKHKQFFYRPILSGSGSDSDCLPRIRNIPALRGTILSCSSINGKNCFLTYENTSLFVWNQSRGNTITLPPLEEDYSDFGESVLWLSSTSSKGLVLLFHSTDQAIIICKIDIASDSGGGLCWSVMHYGDTMRQMFVDVYARAYGTFKDPVCYNGDVYAIYYRHLVILKVDVDGDLFFQPIINCELPPNDGIGSKLCHYLLDSLGDLITIYISMGGIRNNEIIDLEIYKLNFESKLWNRVVHNKDRVIFLGSSHSFSCLTDDHDVGGRIFFTRYGDRSLYSFNIEDESLTITLPCPNLPNPCNSPYWILPTHDEEDDDYEDDVEDDDDEEEEDDDEELDDGYDYHDEELDEDDAVSISIYNDSKVPKQQAQLSLPSWSIQSRDHTDYILVDPISNKKHFMKIPPHLVHTKIRYSRHGWLLMSNNTSNSMFFYNPFTKDSIKLPDPPRGCISNPTFGFLTTSSSSAFSNWVCVGLFSLIPKLMEISYTKSGEEVWHEVSIETDINFVPNNNTPAVLYDEDGHGAFYFLGRHGNLGVLRMENKVKWEVFENPKSPCDCKSYESNFLIECGGELVSVFVGVIGTWVKVFKLNHVLMVWERVNDLGNHMLFIGRYSCSSQLATNPSMVNKIYFPKFSKDDRAVYFSLNTKKFHYSELGAAPAFDSFYSNRIKGPLQSGWIASRFS